MKRQCRSCFCLCLFHGHHFEHHFDKNSQFDPCQFLGAQVFWRDFSPSQVGTHHMTTPSSLTRLASSPATTSWWSFDSSSDFLGTKKTQQKATEHSAFPSISHYECSFTNDSTLAAREVIGSGDLPVSIGVSPQQAAIWAPWPSKAPWANSRINSSKSFCTCAVASAFHVVLSYPIGSMYGIYMLTWGVY